MSNNSQQCGNSCLPPAIATDGIDTWHIFWIIYFLWLDTGHVSACTVQIDCVSIQELRFVYGYKCRKGCFSSDLHSSSQRRVELDSLAAAGLVCF
jgi:hypothetical protein